MRLTTIVHYEIVIACKSSFFYADHKPTMPELTDFPGKTRHFNIAAEIGIKFHAIGTSLLNDEQGYVVPAIVSEYRGNAEQINMDILRCWVQGQGIADCTWRGLLGVLRIHCPKLAGDIEETLTVKNHLETGASQLSIAGYSAMVVNTDSPSVTPSLPLSPVLPPLPLSRPSLEECLSCAGIPVDCASLDKQVTDTTHIASIAKKFTRWRDLFPYFGLEEYEKEEIEVAGDLSEQKRKLLTVWTQRYGPRATYRHLCTILWEQHRVDLVEAVCEAVKSLI